MKRSFSETLDPSDPAIVNPENDRRHRALTGIRKVVTPIRDEVREEQREAKRAYDIANPPAAQDAKAADAMVAEIERLRAAGVSEVVLGAMVADLAALRARNDPNRPKQTTVTPISMRAPFPLDAHEDDEVEGLVVTGPDQGSPATGARGAERGAARDGHARSGPKGSRLRLWVRAAEPERIGPQTGSGRVLRGVDRGEPGQEPAKEGGAMKKCECGEALPEIGLYGVMKHVCRRCGREREVCGASVAVTVPPGAERIEELEREVERLAVVVNRIASKVLK